MNWSHLQPTALLMLLLSGCAAEKLGPLEISRHAGPPPEPTTSEYFKTTGAGFAIQLADQQRTIRSCVYSLSLTPQQSITTALYLRTRFENPTNGIDPLVVESAIASTEEKISIKSPEVRGLRAGKQYRVEVLVFDSPERAREVGRHVQMIQSTVTMRENAQP